MNELVKVIEKDGEKVVSARELYKSLELVSGKFARWSAKYITGNDFAIENYDWVGVDTEVEGNQVRDFALSIEFVKKLCMLSKTKKGEQVREYFLDLEKKVEKFVIPQTYSEALRLSADLAEKNQALLSENTEMKPKAEFYDAVVDSKDAIDMGLVAKTLNLGYGRNTLFEKLRDLKVLMSNNIPYQVYVDKAWFRTIESKYTKPNGDTFINIKTVVLQKGINGILKLLTGEYN